MPTPKSISAIADRADELRDLLIRWCDQNSGSDNTAGLEEMLGLLESGFSAIKSASVERVALKREDSHALRARIRPDAPVQILLSGHYDTVYGTTNSFQKCESPSGDTLRGPGVADMKGGLVVMLAALQAFEKTTRAKRVGFEIILTPDEETGSKNSRPLLVEAASRHNFALVFEPARANGDLVRSRKGTGIVSLTVHGRAAHAGRDPAAGRNAILALCELLPSIDLIPASLPGVLVNVGRISGGSAVNIVPDLARAEINFRVTNEGEDIAVMQRLHELVSPMNARNGFKVEIDGGFNRGPKIETEMETALFAEWRKCGETFGEKFNWQHVGGGSDGNILSESGLQNLDGLGPIGDHLHSSEESIHLPSLVTRAQTAALFLHRVASGEITLPERVSVPAR